MTTPRKPLVIVLTIGILGLGGAAALVPKWRAHVIKRQDNRLYEMAVAKLKDNRPAEALAIVNQQIIPARANAESLARWKKIEIEASTQGVQIPRLMALEKNDPAAVQDDEAASLLLARSYLHGRNNAGFERLKTAWKDRTLQPESWFALDVDRLIINGKQPEARAMLEAASFKDKADIPRLTRLAMLLATDDLTRSWELLGKANALDSRNPEVRLFRSQILERIGKTQLARVEVVAAHLTDPENPWLADQLADFYRRQRQYTRAIEVWTESLAKKPADFVWLKSWFWARVVTPRATPVPPPPQTGPLTVLSNSLAGLETERFWNPEWSQAGSRLGIDRQERFWLSLLESLRTGKEDDALNAVAFDKRRAESWEPEIEAALWRVLSYRKDGTLNPSELTPPPPSRTAPTHQLFALIDAAAKAQRENLPNAVSAELDALLKSDEAFAVTFLAGGWMRAGLDLRPASPALPAGLPPWVPYSITQATRFVRGIDPALTFADAQPRSTELDGLRAEMLLGSSKSADALPLLESVAQTPTDAGFRAAWMLAALAMEKQDAAGAEKIVHDHAALEAHPTGQEILARAALLRKDLPGAEKIYEAIAGKSVEARAFLARQAFAKKDWATARRLNGELLELMPDAIELRANLEAIEKAESKL